MNGPTGAADLGVADAEVEVLIVGAGQAGLAAGRELRRHGVEARLVDAASRVGDSWRSRWDSLRLFTPTAANGLPGTAMTAITRHPSKDETAAFLERYAEIHRLAIQLDTTVTHLERRPGGFTAHTEGRRIHARAVVAATGAHRRPLVPDLAADLDPDLVQLNSLDYRCPDTLPLGPVLVVGAANSGAEIATDLAAAGRTVILAGRDVGHIPRLGAPVFRLMRHIHTTAGPGRLIARAAVGAGGDPLGRIHPRDLTRAGIARVGRITSTVDGLPATDTGPVTGLASIVWCTGARPDLRWMQPALPTTVDPTSPQRVGDLGLPGIHLLGQPYQRTMASHLLGGVGADATALARRITARPSR